MNLYSKLNNYLLNYFPNIWITRVHLFAPIGSIIFVLLTVVNIYVVGYNPANNLPGNEMPIFLLIIPILIFIVYWFVLQARYNVEKSGGKLTVAKEYLNYFIYFFMFALSYFILIAIPMSNDYKVSHSVSERALKQDVEILNLGNTVVNRAGSLTFNGNEYSFYQSDFIDDYYNYDYSYGYDYEIEEGAYEESQQINVKKSELLKIIDNYILAFNKYSRDKITKSANQVIEDNLNNELTYDQDMYWYEDHWYDDTPSNKIYKLQRFHAEGWYHDFLQKEILYIMSVFFALLALMVWIFKQIHWKYFVFGTIALALTPLVGGIFGVLFFEVFRVNEDDIIPVLILLCYAVLVIFVVVGLNAKERNHTSVVMAMYLQLFLPFLPILVMALMDDRINDDEWETIFWFGWIIGLVSIGGFKYIYRKMSLLPSKK